MSPLELRALNATQQAAQRTYDAEDFVCAMVSSINDNDVQLESLKGAQDRCLADRRGLKEMQSLHATRLNGLDAANHRHEALLKRSNETCAIFMTALHTQNMTITVLTERLQKVESLLMRVLSEAAPMVTHRANTPMPVAPAVYMVPRGDPSPSGVTVNIASPIDWRTWSTWPNVSREAKRAKR